jgi:hypothetical protein
MIRLGAVRGKIKELWPGWICWWGMEANMRVTRCINIYVEYHRFCIHQLIYEPCKRWNTMGKWSTVHQGVWIFFHFSVTDIINLTRFDKTMFRGFIVIKYIFQIVIHSSDYSVQTPPFNIWIELRILMDSTCTPGNTGRQAFFFK